ncbi:MAG TPA: di-trans,poly-cis-decaprenylcistransferase [Thermoanaerobaculia bacterium]
MSIPLQLAFSQAQTAEGLHVAIIMDGNGRWALQRGHPRTTGHVAGVEAVRRTVEAARDLGISTLTLFAFSSDNWKRPDAEIRALMGLFRRYLLAEAGKCAENGIRITVIGRRDRLPPSLVRVIEAAEERTASADCFLLRIAVDYSARDAILRAATRLRGREEVSRETFALLLADPQEGGLSVPDVDLLIRTGGEQRLSDFLLWECAYAELLFTDRMWPDFGKNDLANAVNDFLKRERRFGQVLAPAPSGIDQNL